MPDLSEVLIYLIEIRDRTLSYLKETNFSTHSRLWYWLLQHENQHAETIAMVMALHAPQLIAGQLAANLTELPEPQAPLEASILVLEALFRGVIQSWH